MNLVILDEAKIEINEQIAWYRDRDPAAAGSPDRLRHRQGVFTRHGRLHL